MTSPTLAASSPLSSSELGSEEGSELGLELRYLPHRCHPLQQMVDCWNKTHSALPVSPDHHHHKPRAPDTHSYGWCLRWCCTFQDRAALQHLSLVANDDPSELHQWFDLQEKAAAAHLLLRATDLEPLFGRYPSWSHRSANQHQPH